MSRVKYIFFDFNGTLLDDLDLCLNILNEHLKKQNKKELDMETYRKIFTFPISEYYKRAGLDFSIEPYESLANTFIDKYKRRFVECKLFPNTKETLAYLKNKGMRLICLSATEINMLIMQLEYFGIIDYFDDILGIGDIYAKSKEEVALNFIKNNHIDKDKAIMVGDTLHDYECAIKMGVEPILNYSGHQDIEILDEKEATIIKDISILKELL